MPIILYPASVLHTPQEILEEIDNLFFEFIWPNKKHHVKKKVLIQGIEEGGLKMPDIFSMVKAIKLMWVKRLLTKDNNFTHIAKRNCKIPDFHQYFSHNMSQIYLESQPSRFYSQILDYWDEVKEIDLAKMSTNEILNEKLCNNKYILSDNKPFTNSKLSTNNINKIKDILKPDFSLKQPRELNTLTTIEYNQLISAIPKAWKAKLKSEKNKITFKPVGELEVKIGLQYKHIINVKCKDLYWHFINKTYTTPTAVMKWEELYYYVNFNWKHIFTLPYETTSETSLQSMQHQIINRYFPCNAFIRTFDTQQTELCVLCNVEDSLEHYFFHCSFVKQLWTLFFAWWNNITGCDFKLGALDIIFGIMNESKDQVTCVLNYCIILVKKNTIDCRTQNTNCRFDLFLSKLKNRLLIEEYIATINGRYIEFVRKWNIVTKSY